jgi:hypothetical protein
MPGQSKKNWKGKEKEQEQRLYPTEPGEGPIAYSDIPAERERDRVQKKGRFAPKDPNQKKEEIGQNPATCWSWREENTSTTTTTTTEATTEEEISYEMTRTVTFERRSEERLPGAGDNGESSSSAPATVVHSITTPTRNADGATETTTVRHEGTPSAGLFPGPPEDVEDAQAADNEGQDGPSLMKRTIRKFKSFNLLKDKDAHQKVRSIGPLRAKAFRSADDLPSKAPRRPPPAHERQETVASSAPKPLYKGRQEWPTMGPGRRGGGRKLIKRKRKGGLVKDARLCIRGRRRAGVQGATA